MREIKFRGWHKLEKRFVEFELIPNGWCLEEDDLDFTQLEPWMQYTGLKDRNGKEIYEGDIVRKYNEIEPSMGFEIYQIKWSNTRCAFQLEVTEQLGERDWGGYLLYKTNEKLEVIGNIYENPELTQSVKA